MSFLYARRRIRKSASERLKQVKAIVDEKLSITTPELANIMGLSPIYVRELMRMTANAFPEEVEYIPEEDRIKIRLPDEGTQNKKEHTEPVQMSENKSVPSIPELYSILNSLVQIFVQMEKEELSNCMGKVDEAVKSFEMLNHTFSLLFDTINEEDANLIKQEFNKISDALISTKGLLTKLNSIFSIQTQS